MQAGERNCNRLIHSSSPYLLQHAYNPVDWYPWGEEALKAAADRNVPLLISIGYSACHWCHVMEHETFSDPETASVMNEFFVCVKIDREERPDLDHVFMTAVQLLHGNGGWPLNCFALPDGRPFWGATYFRKDDWRSVITQISDFYRERTADAVEQAAELRRGIGGNDLLKANYQPDNPLTDISEKLFESLLRSFDFSYGGTRGAPKFPMAPLWNFVLLFADAFRNEKAYGILDTTLGCMAKGGIFDQLQGGFARYSTDEEWKVPHFEKMLYDNAVLISLYADAYRLKQNPLYRNVIRQTIHFLLYVLKGEKGNFFASVDADSPGGEGFYYTWTEEEIGEIAGGTAALCKKWFSAGKQGLWENGRNILLIRFEEAEFAAENGLEPEELSSLIATWKQKLLDVRNAREAPEIDDKSISGWNALATKALVDAWWALGDEAFLLEAENTVSFIINEMMNNDGSLFHVWKNGRPYIHGFLDDYAYTAEALIEVYQIRREKKWLDAAQLLCRFVIKNFSETGSALFRYAETGKTEISPFTEYTDQVLPSGNSVMAANLMKMGLLAGDMFLRNWAEDMLKQMYSLVERHPSSFAEWASVLLLKNKGMKLLKVPEGITPEQLQSVFSQRFFPHVLITENENSHEWMICTETYCLPPIQSASEALKILSGQE